MRAPEPPTGTLIRLIVGLLEMAGAVVSLGLLYSDGVTTLSLTAATCTTALTTLSIALFGARR